MPLTPPLTISIDEDSLNNMLPDPAQRQDFRDRLMSAANDWSARTGVDIRFASSGQTGNVRVSVSNAPSVRDAAGAVNQTRSHLVGDFDSVVISDNFAE